MSMSRRHEESHAAPFFVRFLEAHRRGPGGAPTGGDPRADEGPLRDAAEGDHAALKCPSEQDG